MTNDVCIVENASLLFQDRFVVRQTLLQKSRYNEIHLVEACEMGSIYLKFELSRLCEPFVRV